MWLNAMGKLTNLVRARGHDLLVQLATGDRDRPSASSRTGRAIRLATSAASTPPSTSVTSVSAPSPNGFF